MGSDIVHPKITFGNELKFTPYAFAKLIWMRDRGGTEVAGYGITATKDPLLVTDFKLVKQKCTSVTFDLDPSDGVEFMETMMDAGLMPWQYSNILIHSHPGDSPTPSGNDEDNFVKAFSHPNWAVMFIIAEGGSSYCRLKINIGPGVVKNLKVAVDWSIPFGGSNAQKWDEEYRAKVTEQEFRMTGKEGVTSCGDDAFPVNGYEGLNDPLLECHWNENGDVVCWDDEKGEYIIYDPLNGKWYASDQVEESTTPEIKSPDEPFASQIAAWAKKYSDNRKFAMED